VSHQITAIDELLALYGDPRPASLTKEVDALTPEYRAFIEAAPLMAVATSGADGLDCSPRGDDPNVVDVIDSTTLRFPDRKGNNRLDTLRNLVADPRIALLFLIPGITETMRINGHASISIDPELIEAYTIDGSAPRTVVEVKIGRVYFQCSRAMMRSRAWDPGRQVDRASLPTCGQMLQRVSGGEIDAETYDEGLEERLRSDLT